MLLAVSNSSARTQVPPDPYPSNRLLITNVGSVIAYVEFGDDTVTAVIPTASVQAEATLTNDGTAPANGSTVTIDGKDYTFQTTLTDVDGHVKIGASNTATMTNLYRAINGTGGTPGTDYALSTVAHESVTATNPTATTVVVKARRAGAAGNEIEVSATSSTPDSHSDWDDTTLGTTTLGADNTGAMPIIPGTTMVIAPSGDVQVAAITSSSTTTLFITPA